MSGGTWAQLWSGVIGSVIGAAVAAWVASFVLGATLKEQSRIANLNESTQRQLAAAAASEQARLSRNQLDEQRVALNKQLGEQRRGLEKQLAEQRREASENRERMAIGDVIGVLSDFSVLFSDGASDSDTLGKLAGALGRWHLESTDPGLRSELGRWPLQWWTMISLSRRPAEVGLTPEESQLIVQNNTAAMLTFARDWPNADVRAREALLVAVKKARDTLPKLPKTGA